MTVLVALGREVIHVEVADDGSAVSVPELRAVGADSVSGRGLAWVQALSAAWGAVRDDGRGNVVWFQIAADAVVGSAATFAS